MLFVIVNFEMLVVVVIDLVGIWLVISVVIVVVVVLMI